jgi:hypothetical protein
MKWVCGEKWVRGAWDPTRPRRREKELKDSALAERWSPVAQGEALWGPWSCAGLLTFAPLIYRVHLELGLGAGHVFRPFLSPELFHTPARAAALCIGRSRVLRFLAGKPRSLERPCWGRDS